MHIKEFLKVIDVGKIKLPSGFMQTSACSIALLGLSLFMISASTTDAEAQSRSAQCRALNAQLASLSKGGSSGGNSAKYRQYDKAAKSQQAQIRKTKRIAKRGRCTGFGLFNSKSSQCRRIVSSLKKMEANLRSLQRKRASFAPKQGGNTRKRNQILRKIKQKRCNVTEIRQANKQQPVKSKRRTLLEQIFGVKTYNENGQRKNSDSQSTNARPSLASLNTFRTLCVRKTDGYYFPISFSTVKDRFDKDQQTCQAMCPGTTVELYHHKMPTEDSEEMVNYRTGTAYAKEPFAFAYRKSIDVEQKCRFATENRVQSIENASGGASTKPKTTNIGLPVFREDPALAPDDHDIKRENLTFAKAKSYLVDAKAPKTEENQLVAENRKVRIVGPAFFPVQ